jgi:hypothetical protein
MQPPTDPTLGPPPRKAQLRRAVRNMRRAYRTLFALVIIICGGWALLDAYRWNVLTPDQRYLTIGFGMCSLLAFIILRLMERPLGRELRLARQGYVAQGQIVAVGQPRGRRRSVTVTYSFRTVAGLTMEGRCVLPRRISAVTLEPGQALEILYDPARPRLNRPRLWLEYVEFGNGHR